MWGRKLISSRSLLAFVFCFLLLPVFSTEPSLPPSPELSPLPSFPVSANLLDQPKPTGSPLTLNERTARQLEAWIVYHGMVKEYVTQVTDWSKQVTDSWEKAKASSTSYESAMKVQIKVRDDEIRQLKGDVVKFTLYGLGGGFLVGLVVGLVN